MTSSTSVGSDATGNGNGDAAIPRSQSKVKDRRNDDANIEHGGRHTNKSSKESALKKIWKKADLDIPTILMMMKAAIPPAISLAMYQATDIAKTYSTLGYLIAIISLISLCILPRAKFIQQMIINVFLTCFGGAIALLMLYTGVQARLHSGIQGRYNSSQSAVCGIWLFFNIYLINTMKAKFPAMRLPSILYAIFINVAAVYGPQFTTTAQCKSFVQQLLEAFLTGMAIATGTSLIILPTSCRKVVTKEITGYTQALRESLKAHANYFQSLETANMLARVETDAKPADSPEAAGIKVASAALSGLHTKLYGDLPNAKREVAFGKFCAEDLSSIAKHLRAIMVPVMGLSSIVDIFSRLAASDRWGDDENHLEGEKTKREKAIDDWNAIMTFVHEPFSNIIYVMDQGLEHALYKLGLVKSLKKPKEAASPDEEARGDLVKPGEARFAEHLATQCKTFYEGKEVTLRMWCERKGIEVSQTSFAEIPLDSHDNYDDIATSQHETLQRQLMLLLYTEYLLYSISLAVLDFVRLSDRLHAERKKSRLIFPGNRRIKKWCLNIFKGEDATHDDTTNLAGSDGNSAIILMGEAFNNHKDPEHLPPHNAWERFGNGIRAIAKFLRSPESAFGFRAACATMTIAIIAFLHDTQKFFTEQRLVWAMIMVAISMTPTTGQSISGFFLRILGTVVAMVASLLAWYIPSQRTAGIIVFTWLFVTCGFWIMLKKPEYTIVAIISCVTTVMIIGYELEVRKIGPAAATSNGQPYYKIYILAPYRLATVACGLGVAFVWTFFPFPISEHSALRQKLGAALYLSANYYSIVHETVMSRIRGDEGDVKVKGTPGFALEKARNKVFSKQMLLIQGLRAHSSFVNWEFPLGGRFPKEEYDIIINCITNIVRHSSLLSYASQTFTQPSLNEDDSHAQWFKDLRKVIGSVSVTSHEITSLLSLLSNSILNGQPLPPYLTPPKAYALRKRLDKLDRDILSIRHIAEPGYAAFAVVQISTRCIQSDLEKLLKTVKKLVGELDFSFHIVSTEASTPSDSSSSLVKSKYPKKGGDKQE